MTIEEQKLGKSVSGKAGDIVLNDGDQCGRAQGYRPGKCQMVLSHTHRDGWPDQDAGLFCDRLRDPFRADDISANHAIGTMLLERADG